MKYTGAAIAAIAILAAALPSYATDTPKTAAVMPTCATGDQVVMVDTSAKTYRLYEPSSNAQSRRDKANAEPKADMARVNAGLKPMCKSAADAMGAKLASGAMKTPVSSDSPAPMAGDSAMPMSNDSPMPMASASP